MSSAENFTQHAFENVNILFIKEVPNLQFLPNMPKVKDNFFINDLLD